MGCLAKIPVPPPKKVKLGPKTVDCYYLGPAQNSSAYRFLVFKSDINDIHVNTIMESRDASFFEDVFPHKRNDGNPVQKRQEIIEMRHVKMKLIRTTRRLNQEEA